MQLIILLLDNLRVQTTDEFKWALLNLECNTLAWHFQPGLTDESGGEATRTERECLITEHSYEESRKMRWNTVRRSNEQHSVALLLDVIYICVGNLRQWKPHLVVTQ